MPTMATTGPPCLIEPWLAGCGGLAEAWPWLIGLAAIVALPVLVFVLVLRRHDR